MPHWNESRLRALAALGDSQNPLFINLPVTIRDLGFEYWCFSVIRPQYPGLAHAQITNLPEAWMTRYRAQRLYARDPLHQHAMSSIQSLQWQPSMFEQAPRLWQAMKELGVVEGMSQALHHSSGLIALLSLGRPSVPFGEAEFQAKTGAVLALTHSLTVASIEQIARDESLETLSTAPNKPLTWRELVILQRAAVGQTAAQIGLEMNLSERTAQFHVCSAITKLGVSNKTAAVAQAIELGLFRLNAQALNSRSSPGTRRPPDCPGSAPDLPSSPC